MVSADGGSGTEGAVQNGLLRPIRPIRAIRLLTHTATAALTRCVSLRTAACKPSLTPLQKEILLNTEVLAINQDTTPAGRLLSPKRSKQSDARPPSDPPAAMVYARMLSDGSAAVAFYNPNDEPANGAVDFAQLGWAQASAKVRDLWAHADLGAATGRYPATGYVTVAAHATTLLRLTQAEAVEAA